MIRAWLTAPGASQLRLPAARNAPPARRYSAAGIVRTQAMIALRSWSVIFEKYN